jgi:hypothetical protein
VVLGLEFGEDHASMLFKYTPVLHTPSAHTFGERRGPRGRRLSESKSVGFGGYGLGI